MIYFVCVLRVGENISTIFQKTKHDLGKAKITSSATRRVLAENNFIQYHLVYTCAGYSKAHPLTFWFNFVILLLCPLTETSLI